MEDLKMPVQSPTIPRSLQAKTLEIWTIFRDAPGLPQSYYVRRFQISLGEIVPDAEFTAVTSSLEAARDAVPDGKTLLLRSPEDDPFIVESWL
jgi:hypothetical protein